MDKNQNKNNPKHQSSLLTPQVEVPHLAGASPNADSTSISGNAGDAASVVVGLVVVAPRSSPTVSAMEPAPVSLIVAASEGASVMLCISIVALSCDDDGIMVFVGYMDCTGTSSVISSGFSETPLTLLPPQSFSEPASSSCKSMPRSNETDFRGETARRDVSKIYRYIILLACRKILRLFLAFLVASVVCLLVSFSCVVAVYYSHGTSRCPSLSQYSLATS